MPYIVNLEAAQADELIKQQRKGSQTMTVGGVFFVMAMVLGIYTFIDHREGTHLMQALSGIYGLIGLILLAIGEWRRSHPV